MIWYGPGSESMTDDNDLSIVVQTFPYMLFHPTCIYVLCFHLVLWVSVCFQLHLHRLRTMLQIDSCWPV